jgi:hypothetical protein
MLTRLLLFAAITGGMASASPLGFNLSGQFAGSDVADEFVSPNGHFSLAFTFDNVFTPSAVTSLGFDIPLANVTYTLNGSTSTIAPSEIRFNTAANGGLLDITFGSGLTAAEFDFQAAQAFIGTTAVPSFIAGSFNISSWTFSDPLNFDAQSLTSQTATIALAPEPFSEGPMLMGLVLVSTGGFRRARRKQ